MKNSLPPVDTLTNYLLQNDYRIGKRFSLVVLILTKVKFLFSYVAEEQNWARMSPVKMTNVASVVPITKIVLKLNPPENRSVQFLSGYFLTEHSRGKYVFTNVTLMSCTAAKINADRVNCELFN